MGDSADDTISFCRTVLQSVDGEREGDKQRNDDEGTLADAGKAEELSGARDSRALADFHSAVSAAVDELDAEWRRWVRTCRFGPALKEVVSLGGL